MIKLIPLIVILFFNACSFKTAQNMWQKKSTNAFNSYTKNFLSDNNMAKNDLQRAIKHAKQSANLTQLARVYLGKCALNISVGIEDNCKEYLNIADVVQNNRLDAYYNFITKSLKDTQIKFLPHYYQEYSKNIERKKFRDANKNIITMPRITSTLLSGVLIKENLEDSSREKIIQLASFYGYKKAVLFWLNEEKKYTKDSKKIEYLNKKISILK